MKQMKKTLKKGGFTLLIGLFLLWTLFPMYWMLITSLKERSEIYRKPPSFWPLDPTAANYVKAFGAGAFGRYMMNSLFVTIIASIAAVAIACLGGYALARIKFRGKGVVMGLLLSTQMFSLITAMVPIYNMFSKLHLIDSLYALIICYTISNIPFCMITISSFFRQIPVTLEEAARIDGCSLLGAVVKITLPAMKPGLVSNFVFAFTGCWNEMFMSLMLINRDVNRTIPAGLMGFVSKFDINWGQMCAGSCVTLIPVILMFFLVQKHIVAGLTSGAVKE